MKSVATATRGLVPIADVHVVDACDVHYEVSVQMKESNAIHEGDEMAE